MSKPQDSAGIEPKPGLMRLRELIARYREYVQGDLAQGNAGWSGAVRSTYISYYRARRHGRRDDRQQQWRKYLNRNQ